jgi:uncharacterized membrane-anchored protein
VAKKKKKPVKRWDFAPLKGSFMVAAIIGFLVSAYYVGANSYGYAFMLVFVLMFIASLISMGKAPIKE